MKYDYEELIKRVEPGWIPFMEENKEDLQKILKQLNDFIKEDYIIFPNPKYVFRTLFYFRPEETKLVLLGQDPYINSEIDNDKTIPQACGMSFSVPKVHKKIPPSLKNIFQEIKNSYPESKIPNNGYLKRWVKKEKILLLNSALTVFEGKSNSHQKIWSQFTDNLIKYISNNNPKTVFLLMGNFAIGKSKLIDSKKHKIFTTVHPSPLSAYNGFFGCGVFKNINDYLETQNLDPIIWLNKIEN